MAGVGPPPKNPAQRVGHSKAPEMRLVSAEYVEPYRLPDDLLPIDRHGEREDWHPATVRWWERWCESPLALNLTAVDWSELEATAVLHHEFFRKRSFTLAAELRLRMAAFGATPADRMRLRILVLDADHKGGAPKIITSSARDRFGGGMSTAARAVGE